MPAIRLSVGDEIKSIMRTLRRIVAPTGCLITGDPSSQVMHLVIISAQDS